MMNLLKLYLVEIGQPEKYDQLLKIAKKYNGVYHQRMVKRCGSSFCFTKEADALAFMEEAKDWPQWKGKVNS